MCVCVFVSVCACVHQAASDMESEVVVDNAAYIAALKPHQMSALIMNMAAHHYNSGVRMHRVMLLFTCPLDCNLSYSTISP